MEDLFSLEHNIECSEELLLDLLGMDNTTPESFQRNLFVLNKKYKEHVTKRSIYKTYSKLLSWNAIDSDKFIEEKILTKKVRSNSGVVVITVFTSPTPNGQQFSCKWDCHYCPKEPGQPRSYLLNEPGVRRANRNEFDAYKQFTSRADTLMNNGHPIDKLEILVLGGTWTSYPEDYREEFIRDIYYSANVYFDFSSKRMRRLSLSDEQSINETARSRIIGITLETRPDTINSREILLFRKYGCTRVQLGVQHTDHNILKLINRKCTTEDTINAIRMLKDSCFKIDIHLMPDLPGASPEIDCKMFNQVLKNSYLQADQWKIYPCSVTPWTKIEKWFSEGKYIPYTNKNPQDLVNVIMYVKQRIHPWIRLNRIIRDIPNEYIIGGNNVTNLRQIIHDQMKKYNIQCRCIRCREVKNTIPTGEIVLKTRLYYASGGCECFISYESPDSSILYGFCRLRITHHPQVKELNHCAFVRELHVYGKTVPVNHESVVVQHKGLGSKLLIEAEKFAFTWGYSKMAVISGVGTREYYRKRGYTRGKYYQIKHLFYWNWYILLWHFINKITLKFRFFI